MAELKVLVIDDNHSFMDMLKQKLNHFSFQFDTTFRFDYAEKLIEKNGAFISKNRIDEVSHKVQEFLENGSDTSKKWSLKPNLKKLKHLYNENGYSLIILENKTERIPKGTGFIQKICSLNSDFELDDFILLDSNSSNLRSQPNRLKVPCFVKDIRNQSLFEHIERKVQHIHERMRDIDTLFNDFNRIRELYDIEAHAKAKKPAKKLRKR